MNLQKKIYIALGAASVVIIGYVLFIKMNKKRASKYNLDVDDLLDEVSLLGQIKLNRDGLVSFDNFMAIVRIISKHSKIVLESSN